MSDSIVKVKKNKECVDLFSFRNANRNKDFTLIARDCIGGILYHQLGLRFASPTINLFFTPEDFNSLCLHLKEYLDGELVEFKDDSVSYPAGMLIPITGSKAKPIRVDFLHYETFLEASAKWKQRKSRINWDNLFVISSFCYSTELPSLSDQLVEEWNAIPYKKMVFVTEKRGFDGEYVIQKPKDCKEFAWLLFAPDEKSPWKRVFNEYDFLSFLNERN